MEYTGIKTEDCTKRILQENRSCEMEVFTAPFLADSEQ